MSDLLTKLGSKDNSGTTSGANKFDAPSQDLTNTSSTGEAIEVARRGTNILDQLGKASSDAKASETASKSPEATQSKPNATTESASSSESTEPASSLSDEKSRTMDSYMDEIKKLREESKAQRLKYQESINSFRSEQELKIAAERDKLSELEKAREELLLLKEKEADKKRDLNEKLAHRESVLAELKLRLEQKDEDYNNQISQIKSELENYKADSQAQEAVFKNRLEEELKSIPEKYKDTADLLVRGAGKPRDGLLAIQEAKLKGIFDDKTSVVVHDVPGAKTGARTTNEQIQSRDQERRDNMTSGQKIREALGGIKSGEKNAVYRNR